MFNWKKLGLFAGGVLFGTAGISILKSKDMKKAYTHCTAAVLRGKDSVVKCGTSFKEGCGDIYADAKDINEKRYADDEKKEIERCKAVIAENQAKVEEYEKKTAAASADKED